MFKLVCKQCRDVIDITKIYSEREALNSYVENVKDKILVKESGHIERTQFNQLVCRLCRGTDFNLYLKKY